MRWLSDSVLEHLRTAAPMPQVQGRRYHVVGPLARGGMGEIYLAEDTSLDREVALKALALPDPGGGLTARLLQEARVLARLEHPGIVPVHDVGELTDGRLFYTMKLVRGRRLDGWLAEGHSLADRLRLMIRVCEPVAFAHAQGVLHRDLKPENIMVGPFGEVLVMDWGVAKVMAPREAAGEGDAPVAVEARPTADLPAAPGPTAHGTVVGTPGFMAPEQARGAVGELTARADVYSLGAVLALLLGTGTVGAGFGESEDRLPKRLAAIAGKALAAEATVRYADAGELAADLQRFLDGRPVAALPEGLLTRAGRFLARHRVAVFLLLAYALVRALVVLFLGR